MVGENVIFKWAKDLNRHFSKEGIKISQEAHKKILSVTNHQGNASQNTMK